MPRKKYTSEFKTKIVLSILQGDKEFNVICSANGLNPNMVRKWKQEFLQNAHLAFGADSERKAVQRKKDDLKKKNDQMLRTIGQLTLERDFLQDCFRQAGEAIPRIPEYDQKG
ncbi:transposase [uncultured Acidaminococcus sp.]|uniref:transposase n=1 Tax=uncultured Acidaminococcus sp. TaxID=352152 RepID=UPI00262AA042|nr:transposase [uncultured Acidaminococcus sp.]